MSEISVQRAAAGAAEYLRPWKVFTLLLGIALLILGSFYHEAPDWDIPISLIMAVLAYLTAPWSVRVIAERRWKLWPAMLFATWFTVDGSYWLYWHFKNPDALEWMRDANFFASLALYGICGVIWLYRGSLRELCSEIGALYRQSKLKGVIFVVGACIVAFGVLMGIRMEFEQLGVRALVAGCAFALLGLAMAWVQAMRKSRDRAAQAGQFRDRHDTAP